MRLLSLILLSACLSSPVAAAPQLYDLVQAYLASIGKVGDPIEDFQLGNQGDGVRIVKWNEAKLGPKPSIEQLNTLSSAAEAQADERDRESLTAQVPAAFLKILLQQENRLRALEGKQALSAAQYRAALKAAAK